MNPVFRNSFLATADLHSQLKQSYILSRVKGYFQKKLWCRVNEEEEQQIWAQSS